MKYHLIALGCQMNISDDERIRTIIEGMGYTYTDNEEEANLLGLLACSVRQKAIDQVYNRIHKWNRWKNNKILLTFVSGCILPADYEKFLKLFDLVFQTREIENLPELISNYGMVTAVGYQFANNKNMSNKEIEHSFREGQSLDIMKVFWEISPHYKSAFEAYIPIQNGCDKFCTYCAVPYTRGREVSRSSDDIMKELIELVEQGYKSITLLGQNVNSYGLDKKCTEIGFSELLKRIGEYGNHSKEEFWVYFTSPHPRDMTNDVIDVISEYDCLAKQIHLPLQSGDDEVLDRMNRQHTLKDYRKIIHYIQKTIPKSTIFTDIIVGFTGETELQFENSRLAMEEFAYNMAYIAKYSPRPGAVSSKWQDDISKEQKKNRYDILTNELIKHSYLYNQKLLGTTLKVLVKNKARKKGYLSAYTEGRIVARFKSDDENLIGSIVSIKITSAAQLSIEGKLQ